MAKDATRKAIIEAFIHLLEERPVSKITVRDIATRSGVNRNTFYYHFRDIPTLVESIVEDAAKEIIASSSPTSLEDCLESAIAYALKYRRQVKNIYASTSRSIFESSLWRVCEAIVKEYLSHMKDAQGMDAKSRAAVESYLKALLFGLISLWLEGGMDEDARSTLHTMARLKEGDLASLIERAAHF